MDEKKPEDLSGVGANTTPEAEAPKVEVAPAAEVAATPVVETTDVDETVAPTVVAEEAPHTQPAKSFNLKAYVGMVLVIVVICAGLLFVLEKEGRTSTGLFSGIISSMESNESVATVNGVEIKKVDFDSSLNQLTNMSADQGADVTNPSLMEQLKTQALETLVTAEVLRQKAVAEGIDVNQEQIDTRYEEIKEGIGGEEALMERMTEFGVTEESLRRDIENEFLIQGLFDAKVDTSSIEVSEAEVVALYAQAGGAEGGLPPLEEVREQIDAQIKFDKEQALVGEYIESVKAEAKIEVEI
jgi:hypothetical protein